MSTTMPEQYRPYAVMRRTEEAPGVATFYLKPKAGERPALIAGQFVNIALSGHIEAKSYTIASAPKEKEIAVTVRRTGNFSQALMAHREGDTLLLSAPFGYFYSENTSAPRPRLWLAGGIGITPFISMVRDAEAQSPTVLYYSNRTAGDAVFAEELAAAAHNQYFLLHHFITREPAPRHIFDMPAFGGRIAEPDLAGALKKMPDVEVYICGSIGFVRDYWSMFRRLGIPEERLFTEAFF